VLTVILGVTLIGFALLVVALVTSQFALAVACIVVCALGLVLLLIDAIRASRRSKRGTDDDPLFTIRGRESAVRADPLLGDDAPDQPAAADGADAEDRPLAGGAGLGGLVVDEPLTAAAEAAADEAAEQPAPSAPVGPGTGEPAEGDAGDYIRSVTGSFPVQRPAGATPTSAPDAPSVPETPPVPQTGPNPQAGPVPQPGPAPQSGPPSAPWPAAQPPYPQQPVPPAAPAEPGPGTGPIPATSPYVGRRRRAERTEPPITRPAPPEPETGDDTDADEVSSETMILHDQTGPLPKITFVDPDEQSDGDDSQG